MNKVGNTLKEGKLVMGYECDICGWRYFADIKCENPKCGKEEKLTWK